MFRETQTAAESAGTISKEWAKKLGLSEDTLIGVGAFDAHMGAVGGQIEPYYLSKVMGTSTCDILVVPQEEMGDILVKGICGQVTGSVLPRMVGLEAGQSAFGDAYAWFRMLLMEPVEALLEKSNLLSPSQISLLKEELNNSLITWLSDRAAALPVTLQAELATDWFNGRRTPDANQLLKATITGVDLGTDAVHFFGQLLKPPVLAPKQL
jgi:L-ribulokinase